MLRLVHLNIVIIHSDPPPSQNITADKGHTEFSVRKASGTPNFVLKFHNKLVSKETSKSRLNCSLSLFLLATIYEYIFHKNMDIKFWPTYPLDLCPIFFSLKNMVPANPTYLWFDICLNFRSFFFLYFLPYCFCHQISHLKSCPNECTQTMFYNVFPPLSFI